MVKWAKDREAAEYFGVCRNTIRNMVNDGRIPASAVLRIPGLRINLEAAEDALAAAGPGRPPSTAFALRRGLGR